MPRPQRERIRGAVAGGARQPGGQVGHEREPAIAHRHHQAGLPDPTADIVVRRVRRGLRHIMGTAPRRQAHPLTVVEIGELVSRIELATAIGVRDCAVILLGYASALRPGEISALDIADITAKPTGILVTVRRSKTDQDGPGAARRSRPRSAPAD